MAKQATEAKVSPTPATSMSTMSDEEFLKQMGIA
jgi:hypothetical protein